MNQETVKLFSTISAIILAAGALSGSIYGLIINSVKFQRWLEKRRERKRVIDNLISNADDICTANKIAEETADQIREINTQQKEIMRTIETLVKTQEKTIEHNKRQDRAIAESLQQRELHTRALFATLDGLRQLNANGHVTKTRNELEEYITHMAHEE